MRALGQDPDAVGREEEERIRYEQADGATQLRSLHATILCSRYAVR